MGARSTAMHSPGCDPTDSPGATWRHTYASGHRGRITKVSAVDYLVEVEPPPATGAAFVRLAVSLTVAVTKANQCVGEASSPTQWDAGEA
jgi:hypothetical protein